METPAATTDAPAAPVVTTPAPAPAAPSPSGRKGIMGAFKDFKEQQTKAPKAPAAEAPAPAPAAKESAAVTKPDATPAKTEKGAEKEKPAAKAAPVPLKKGLEALVDEPAEPTASETPAPADDSDAPPDAKTPEAKNAWSALKTEAKTLREKEAAWTAEKTKLIADLEAAKKVSDADPVKKRNAELEEALKEREARLAKYDIRETDEFKRTVGIPLERALKSSHDLAKAAEVPVTKLEAAIYKPNDEEFHAAMDEILEALPVSKQHSLMAAANRVRELEITALELEQNALPALTETKAREAEAATKAKNEQRAAEMREVADSREKLLKAASYFKIDGEADDSVVDAVLAEANAVPFDELNVKDKAFAAVASALVPRMQRAFKTQRDADAATIKSLKAEMEALVSSNPRTDGGHRGSATGTTDDTMNPDGTRKGLAQVLKERMRASAAGG